MSISINYPFLIPGNYTFSSSQIEVSAGCRLSLQQGNVDFTEDFLTSSGLTIDSQKAEWLGDPNYLVRQKDMRPAGALVYAGFTTDEDSNYAPGSVDNTLVGGATWDSGQIDLTGASGKRLNMPGTGGNFNTVGSAGCIRFGYTPNYGTLVGVVQILEYDAVTGNNNMIQIYQNGANVIIDLRDSVGAQHLLIASVGNFTQGQKYTFELNFDFDGTSRFFVDGVVKGSLNTSGWTRVAEDGTFKWGGATGTGNFWLDDVITFDSVQHTSDHAGELPFTYYPSIYAETTVILPEMEHTGDGTIKLFNSFTTVEAGAPRYVLQIGRSGNYLYWTGSAWAVSDGSYAQANDQSTFNTNCGSLPVDGEKYGQFAIIFPDSNTVSSVSQVNANMNVDIGYLTTNPSILINATFRHEALEGFFETATKAGSDELKYTLKKGSDFYWWTGSTWAVSDGTYSQSNTAAEIYTNRAAFTTEIVVTQIKIFLHSADGSTTPELTDLEVQYNFAGETPDTINTCIVWGVAATMAGAPLTDTITVSLNKESVQYKTDTVIRSETITITPDSVTGYWEVELVETENMETSARYIFDFGGDRYERQVPDEQDKKFWDLVA